MIQDIIETLLENDILPIVNENDITATSEQLFGDNDQLSANIAYMTDANLLVILSDIDGYFDKNPKEFKDAKILKIVDELSDEDKAKITNAINAGIDEVFPYLSKSSQVRAAENLKPAGVKLEDWLYTVNKYKGQYPITQLAATVEKRYANRSAK